MLTDAGLSPAQQKLELLVDEYAQADGLDRKRRDRLAKLIVETAEETGLAAEAGISARKTRIPPFRASMPFSVTSRILPSRMASTCLAVQTKAKPIPCGCKVRKPSARRCWPRSMAALFAPVHPARLRVAAAMFCPQAAISTHPTRVPCRRTAFELGRLAADEVIRRYLQDHGDWPKNLIIDLWGSASLRSGGEEVAQGLALMGARPVQDAATGRVTGIEVLPPAQLGRPRVDVTFRISGLFRDMFPSLIALLDAATRSIATREEAEGDNPLAEEAKMNGKIPPRIFGSAPGTYGSGIEEKLSSGDWQSREELGRAYLAMTSHAFGGADGDGFEAADTFAERVRQADLLVHTGDDPGRDLLDGSGDVAFIGGFAAAVAALGGKADLISLDTTNPQNLAPARWRKP